MPSSSHNEQIDWYKPLDDSPSAWMMLKHLGLLIWQRLCEAPQTQRATVNLERKVDEKALPSRTPRRFETSSKRLPLMLRPSIATYLTPLASLSPYDLSSLEEETPELVLDGKELEQNSDFKKKQARKLSQEPPVAEPHSSFVPRPIPPKTLDSIEDINTWILLNIDDQINTPPEKKAKASSTVNHAVESIVVKPLLTSPSSQGSTHLKQHVAQTQASIDALVNAYFSQN
jgi:hypothetical protein